MAVEQPYANMRYQRLEVTEVGKEYINKMKDEKATLDGMIIFMIDLFHGVQIPKSENPGYEDFIPAVEQMLKENAFGEKETLPTSAEISLHISRHLDEGRLRFSEVVGTKAL